MKFFPMIFTLFILGLAFGCQWFGVDSFWISASSLIVILTVHWFADFHLQTDEMAKNKSRCNWCLASHVGIYALMLVPFGPVYALGNGLAHFAVDWVTSRWTSHLWAKGDRHNFFVVIGFDQLLHVSILVLTIPLMGWS